MLMQAGSIIYLAIMFHDLSEMRESLKGREEGGSYLQETGAVKKFDKKEV